MATGFTQRFRGKIRAESLSVASFSDAASGVAGKMQGVVKKAIAVTATANTDLTTAVPPGATILSMAVYTTTAFTAATDATIAVGSAAGGAQYVAAVSIKAIGFYPLTLVNAGAANLLSAPALTSGNNIFIRIAQSGSTTAVGAATLVIEYA